MICHFSAGRVMVKRTLPMSSLARCASKPVRESQSIMIVSNSPADRAYSLDDDSVPAFKEAPTVIRQIRIQPIVMNLSMVIFRCKVSPGTVLFPRYINHYSITFSEILGIAGRRDYELLSQRHRW